MKYPKYPQDDRLISYHYGTKSVEIKQLRHLYLDENLSLIDVGKKLHISNRLIKKLLLSVGIPLKNQGGQSGKNNQVFKAIERGNWKDPMKRVEVAEKVAIKRRGKNNPNWKGGVSGRSTYYRGLLRRLGIPLTTCTDCGTKTEGRQRHIHHIDKDPFNDSLNNLKVLCPKCHAKYHKWGNHNRGGETKPCIICGTSIYAHPYEIKTKKFCSRKCYEVYWKTHVQPTLPHIAKCREG